MPLMFQCQVWEEEVCLYRENVRVSLLLAKLLLILQFCSVMCVGFFVVFLFFTRDISAPEPAGF